MRKGFTLVELLIVITIIALLSAIAIPSYMKDKKDKEEAISDKEALVEARKPLEKLESNSVIATYMTSEQKLEFKIKEKERTDCHLHRLCEVDGYTVYSVYSCESGTKVIAIPKGK